MISFNHNEYYYDTTKYTELKVDAFPVRIGAILAQKESEDEEDDWCFTATFVHKVG